MNTETKITTTEIAALLAAGEWEIKDDTLIVEPKIWHATDGNGDTHGEFDSAEEAAEAFANGGDWGGEDGVTKTIWVRVCAYREGIDADGDVVRVDEETHTISVDPDEPDCCAPEHDWHSPLSLVGGCKENPGVFGHGGGTISHEICRNCGTERICDSWAQNPETGEQGLDSVQYKDGEYADEMQARMEKRVEWRVDLSTDRDDDGNPIPHIYGSLGSLTIEFRPDGDEWSVAEADTWPGTGDWPEPSNEILAEAADAD